jgi:hypothetical protein
MKYVMPWGLPFIQPQFTRTSLHFTSLHCLFDDPPPRIFAGCISFLTRFLKLLGLQGRVPKTCAGSWFQSWMVLFTKEYFPISLFCFLLLIFLSNLFIRLARRCVWRLQGLYDVEGSGKIMICCGLERIWWEAIFSECSSHLWENLGRQGRRN